MFFDFSRWRKHGGPHGRYHHHHSTPNYRCEPLLVGWKRGALRRGPRGPRPRESGRRPVPPLWATAHKVHTGCMTMTGGLRRAGRQDGNDRMGMWGDDADANVMSQEQEQDQPVVAAEVVFSGRAALRSRRRSFKRVRSTLLTSVLLSSARQPLLMATSGSCNI